MPDDSPARAARRAAPAALAALLADARARTLRTFDAYADALGEARFAVPYSAEVNPPLWELGHVGWFHAWWLRRNPERALGTAADPDAPRLAPRRAVDDDARFDSGRVPHLRRWQLALPPVEALRDGLAQEHADTLALLRDAGDGDDSDGGSPDRDAALYFFRLCLFHEDMHHEAAVYMAQTLGVPLDLPTLEAHRGSGTLRLEGGEVRRGAPVDAPGFAFDNELGTSVVRLAPYAIDAVPVDWARYLAFVETGGAATPRHLRRLGRRWQRRAFGRWIDLDPALPAMHLSCAEAEAWCAWAGRRLPTEAEWQHAAETAGPAFEWGRAWEWTATPFAPFDGFVAHPYRDYSAPWFGTRRVLRGGSFATVARMKHTRYRNFYPPGRCDIFAGFRSCGPHA